MSSPKTGTHLGGHSGGQSVGQPIGQSAGRSSKIYDISPMISERIGVFPGDTQFSRNVLLDIEQGDNIGLSALTTTVHLGAHADAPNHYQSKGEGIATRDLRRYLGPCLLVTANAPAGSRIKKEHLTTTNIAPRMLVRTGSFPNPEQWNSDFSSFDPELIEWWAKLGVTLIGIDTPSIDPETSKDLPSHAMVAKYDLAILEGLVFNGIPDGRYTLIALPLKIENADASPVRAVLVDGPLTF